MKSRRRKDAGFALLIELLIVCIVTSIVMCGAVVSWQGMRAVINMQGAEARIRQFGNANALVTLCAMQTGCVSPSGAIAITQWPAMGSPINIQRYTWTYVPGPNWSMTATPQTPQDGTYSFYVDQSNSVRCALGSAVTATSPVCNW